jgi:hypothetical protein
MRYVNARIDEFSRDEAYRIYITKSLQLIPQSKHLTKDYIELFEPQDERTGEDIVSDIMLNAGLKFEG